MINKVLASDTITKYWGENIPQWVKTLAAECDNTSQARTAKKIGYSAAAINCVLQNKYTGTVGNVEEAVKAYLMSEEVSCPVLGNIKQSLCLENQKQPLITSNPTKIRLFKACRAGCPHFKGEKK
ncbi:MAG: hypothetical protein AB7U85_04755 [Alphaproteobacteria bacterium]